MSKGKPLAAGDTIWVVPPSYRGNGKEPEPWIVSKVGRQYVYAKRDAVSWQEIKLHSDSLISFVGPNDNGAYRYAAYQFREQWELEVEENRDRAELESFCRNHRGRDLSIKQVRSILSIVKQQP